MTTASPPSDAAPAGWQELHAGGDIQFAPVEVPELPPRAPNWLDRLLEWLGEWFSPLGRALGDAWPVARWFLLALGVALAIYVLLRLFAPDTVRRRKSAGEADATSWLPDRDAALALLEDADRLAEEGRFDEATHLLLARSVGQIALARPEWVEPSSTARELANLPSLPTAARSAFAIIAERVEHSLFALRRLGPADWQAARAAYADFALVRIEGSGS